MSQTLSDDVSCDDDNSNQSSSEENSQESSQDTCTGVVHLEFCSKQTAQPGQRHWIWDGTQCVLFMLQVQHDRSLKIFTDRNARENRELRATFLIAHFTDYVGFWHSTGFERVIVICLTKWLYLEVFNADIKPFQTFIDEEVIAISVCCRAVDEEVVAIAYTENYLVALRHLLRVRRDRLFYRFGAHETCNDERYVRDVFDDIEQIPEDELVYVFDQQAAYAVPYNCQLISVWLPQLDRVADESHPWTSTALIGATSKQLRQQPEEGNVYPDNDDTIR